MNLYEGLNDLARQAPPPVDSDRVIQLARRAKARRATYAASAVAVAAVLAYLPFRGTEQPHPPAAPTQARTVAVMTTSGPANLEAKRPALAARALALGLEDPQIRIVDTQTVEVSVKGEADESLVRAVALPQWLHLRKVLDHVAADGGGERIAGSGTAKSLDQVVAKLGDAYAAAETIAHPHRIDPATKARLAAFGRLSGSEVELLPAEIQFAVPHVTCAHLAARPTFAGLPLFERVTTCSGTQKVFLDAAKLSGDDVAFTNATVDQGEPVVHISFTQPGAARLTELTQEAFHNTGESRCHPEALGAAGRCLVAISLGAHVLFMPEIQAVLSASVSIARLGAQQAQAIAEVLSFKDVPLTLRVLTVHMRHVVA